jgi:hypothetical protein
MFDFDDGARAKTHELLCRIIEPYAHGKTLGDTDPVQRPLNIGN